MSFPGIGIGLISREKSKKSTWTQLIVVTVVDKQHKAIGASVMKEKVYF